MGSVGQYSQAWLPWMGTKTVVGVWTPTNDSGALGMGEHVSDAAQNDEFTNDVWLDTGTWKIALVHYTNSDRGIYNLQFDGVSQGTIDGYSAGATKNVYSELTGLSVTVAGLKTLKLLSATKNGSSSNYRVAIQSVALIRTSGTSSTPAGTDTPGYTWHYLPWMGVKSSVNALARTQFSGDLGGGNCTTSGAQNDEMTWDIWLDVGTYKYAQEYMKDVNLGIYSVQLDTVEKGTIDGYNGSTLRNNYSEITGITVATAAVKAFKLKMATKNGSSSAYYAAILSSAWIRTGA